MLTDLCDSKRCLGSVIIAEKNNSNHMPYFRTTRRFAPGCRLGHDRIGPCGVAMGHDRIGPCGVAMGHDRIGPCGHIKSRYVHNYNNPVNVGITYIPSADLYYRLAEL